MRGWEVDGYDAWLLALVGFGYYALFRGPDWRVDDWVGFAAVVLVAVVALALAVGTGR